jgi:hypothetical protein
LGSGTLAHKSRKIGGGDTMDNSYKLIEEGRKDELWIKHCGFLSLSRKEFKDIQKRLMLEQLTLLGSSRIGKALMGGKIPASLDEYRQTTPLTTYADYSEILMNKKEDDLPEKPYVWARTSGRSTDLGPKWIPYTKAMYDRLSDPVIGAMLMSSCSQPGDVRLERNDKFLMSTAPPPYSSGYIARSTKDNLEVIFLPKLDVGENMSYGERVALGFKLAMREGLDYFMGISVVLARMGEQFEQQSSNSKPSKDLLNIPTLWRLLKALVISKIQKRNILPKDIWHLKGIMSGGTDTEIYKDRIEYYWGKKPLEGFACTEAGNMAMQAWNFKGMVFFPDNAFLEFIPLEEVGRNRDDPAYQPKTFLYDELDLGIYELVLSNFNGGVLVRYRIGDLFEVISNGDEEISSELPQMRFYSRSDDIIDLGSFLRLTERDIWKTIEAAGLEYRDWVARKQIIGSYPTLHLYVELVKAGSIPEEKVQEMIRQSFSARFSDYNDMKEMLGIEPVVVTLIPDGSFTAYMKSKMEAGADLAHLKPPHMKPSDEVLMKLLGTPNKP